MQFFLFLNALSYVYIPLSQNAGNPYAALSNRSRNLFPSDINVQFEFSSANIAKVHEVNTIFTKIGHATAKCNSATLIRFAQIVEI